MLKFCCILYFPQLPFDSSSSWKYWALRDPVLKAGWDAPPYSRCLLLWCYFVGFCFLSQNWWKVCNAAKTMGKYSPVVVLDFPLILFILPSTQVDFKRLAAKSLSASRSSFTLVTKVHYTIQADCHFSISLRFKARRDFDEIVANFKGAWLYLFVQIYHVRNKV